MERLIYVIEDDYEDKYHKPHPILFYKNYNECYICISHCLNNSGYPSIGRYRKITSVARYLYEKEYGFIEKRLQIRHKCDNPQCINIKHLEVGTVKDNHRDMILRGRSTKGEKHPGHKLTEEQVLWIKKDNRSHRIIAEEYGVARTTITYIKTGRNWGWLVG